MLFWLPLATANHIDKAEKGKLKETYNEVYVNSLGTEGLKKELKELGLRQSLHVYQ